MKISQDRGVIERSGDFVEKSFKIAATAKAFQVLSSGLYSDKITAIIRELSTNAYDAHIDAKTADLPFHVHLPDSLDGNFWIRDFGTGLSKQDIEELYTTYFASNKTHSDDFVGCMGLGSKSPFSYVDNFLVTSYFNGNMYIYTCMLNEDGFPTVVLREESKTDQPNGLFVQLAVKEQDFYSFEIKAENVYKYFKTKPVFFGTNQITIEEPQYLLKTDSFGLHQTATRNSKVIMGNVGYSIGVLNFNNLNEAQQKLLNHGIDLFMPIGSVGITANRETLEFRGSTITKCMAALDEAVFVIMKTAEKELADAPNLWAAKLYFINNKNSVIADIGWSTKEIEWQGHVINETQISLNKYDKFEVVAQEEDVYGTPDANGKLPLVDLTKRVPCCNRAEEITFASKRWNHKTKSRTNVTAKRSKVESIPINNETKVFINDTRGSGSLVEHQMITKGWTKNCYLIDEPTDAFLKESGLENIAVYTSTLPPVPKEIVAKRKRDRNISKLYAYAKSDSTNLSTFWKPVDVDLADGGIYVVIHHFRCDSTSGRKLEKAVGHPAHLAECIDGLNFILREEGKQPITVYGIRDNHLRSLKKKHKNWVHLSDFATTYLESRIDLLEAACLMQVRNKIDYKCAAYNFQHWWKDSFDEIDPLFAQYHLVLKQLKEIGKELEQKASMYNKLYYEVNLTKFNASNMRAKLGEYVDSQCDEIFKISDNIIDKYPLINLFHNIYHSDEKTIQEVENYILSKNQPLSLVEEAA